MITYGRRVLRTNPRAFLGGNMRITRALLLSVSLAAIAASAACGTTATASWHSAPDSTTGAVTASPSAPDIPANAEIPTYGSGTFATATGQGKVIGAGTTRVRYRVAVEKGIVWGNIPAWTAEQFAESVAQVLAAPQGWTDSAKHPITNTPVHLSNASWSFQRVDSEADADVDVRLATPQTVDTLCGSAGLATDGVYSCKYGKTIMINLRRWLQGAPEYPVSIDEYHANVINHEFGHFLGFEHMKCPAPGMPAPVMMTQTIDLGGCVPNAHPFSQSGEFISGPWKSSAGD
jgi:hypothetical protein